MTNDAHRFNPHARRFGEQTWIARDTPMPHVAGSEKPYMRCSYCHSMAPSELAAALAAGASISFAPYENGWPAKYHVDGIPVDQLSNKKLCPDTLQGSAMTHGKFYAVHLRDATQEERIVIERAIGITFTFNENGTVSWLNHETDLRNS